jgi:hypothetical protein
MSIYGFKNNKCKEEILEEIAVSSTEPTTNEKVWFKTDNNSIMVKNDNGEFEEFIKKEEDTGWVILEDYGTTDAWRGKIQARRKGSLVQIKADCYPPTEINIDAFGTLLFNTLPEVFKPLDLVRDSVYAKDGSNNIIDNLCLSITADREIALDNTSGQNVTSMSYFTFNATYFVD